MNERFTFNGIEIEDNKKGIEYNTFMKESCEKITNQLNELVNENKRLQEEKEHYRKYAILYLQDFDLYSVDFIETIRSINGDEFANKMLKDREEIINALQMEGLYE